MEGGLPGTYVHFVRLEAPQNQIILDLEKIGAGEEIRTLDFNLGKVALYP